MIIIISWIILNLGSFCCSLWTMITPDNTEQQLLRWRWGNSNWNMPSCRHEPGDEGRDTLWTMDTKYSFYLIKQFTLFSRLFQLFISFIDGCFSSTTSSNICLWFSQLGRELSTYPYVHFKEEENLRFKEVLYLTQTRSHNRAKVAPGILLF